MAHLRGDDKRQYVAEMFARISPRYDLMNSLMTGGLHHRWNGRRPGSPPPGCAAPPLDVATGTGDLAFALARCPGIDRAVGVDLLSEMLTIARDKPAAHQPQPSPPHIPSSFPQPHPSFPRRRESSPPVSFVMGDALQLPFPTTHSPAPPPDSACATWPTCRQPSRRWPGWSPPAAASPRWN